MRANTLKRTLAAGGTATNAWLSIPSSFSAEVVAHCGFDAVTVDMQHGMIDFSQAMTMFQAISTTNAVPIGRPICSSPVEIMRLLDAGAYGVICPQVDTAETAAQHVDAPAGRVLHSPEQAEQRGLSGAVRPDQRPVLTPVDLERDPGEDVAPLPHERDVGHREDTFGHPTILARPRPRQRRAACSPARRGSSAASTIGKTSSSATTASAQR